MRTESKEYEFGKYKRFLASESQENLINIHLIKIINEGLYMLLTTNTERFMKALIM